MPRAKAPPRVKGPYSERSGTRFRIRVCDLAGHRDLYFSTLKEAMIAKEEAGREFLQSVKGRSLGEIIDEYTRDKVQRGLCNARSASEHQARLRVWFCDRLEDDISKLTAKRAAALYERLVSQPTLKTGQPPMAATHRFYLKLAQALFRWTVRKGYLRESPFEKIQPVGRPNRGKKQLRFDEAERFITSAFEMFDERGDTMALAAVAALLLGCRASEVLHLRVRDLDCGGTKLWVAAHDSEYHGKSHNAARDPDVPDVLRPRLLKLTAGQAPDAFLFGLSSIGKPRSRQVLHATVKRVCLDAGVPIVCPHSLRGLWATAGVRSGALSHAVAAALGHGSFAVTAKHYVQPGTLDGARTERLVQMLDLDAEKQASKHASPSAEQLLASLPPETLARLVALAVGTAEQKVQRFTYGSFEALRDQRCHNGRHKLSLDYLERLYAVVELRADEFGWQRPTWTRESLALTLAEQDFPLLAPCTVGRALREIPLAEQSVWPRSEDPLPLNTQLHVGIPIAASQASRRPAPPSCRRSGAS